MKRALFLLLWLFPACASKPYKSETPLGDWVSSQERRSWELLQLNISPEEPKIAGGPKPRRGIVVAALHKKDPDYYFHWVRDSANVMRVLAEHEKDRPAKTSSVDDRFRDFLQLSRDVQLMHTPFGMGEPRFTVEGQVDQLKWSRPQYDGPALRALATMEYLNRFQPPPELRKLALDVLWRDLDFTAAVWSRRGFDLWEELFADNYHTRLVQMAALEQGKKLFPGRQMAASPASLRTALDGHWDQSKGYYRSQLVIERTDGYTKKNTDLDSAIVVAVVESGRLEGRHSVLDDRVHATVWALENLFRATYPINKGESALLYGRYAGDAYYGGNPWPLITSYYAQFYFRLARAAAAHDIEITPLNKAFIESLLPGAPARLTRGSAMHRKFLAACMSRADRILARLRAVTPDDGQFYEQVDKQDGHPVSSRGIGWAHAAFIAASLERSRAVTEIQLPTE